MMSIVGIYSNDTSATTSSTTSNTIYNPGTVTILPNSNFSIDSSNVITYIGTVSPTKAIIKYNITYTTTQTSGTMKFYILYNGTTLMLSSYTHRSNNASGLINLNEVMLLPGIFTNDTFQIVCVEDTGSGTTLTNDIFKFGICV